MALALIDFNEEDFQHQRSKGKKRKLRKQRERTPQNENILNHLTCISPKTKNQEKVFNHFEEGKHLYLNGVAGTGKTFLSLFLSLEEFKFGNQYKEIIIVRSAVPSRDIGHLPGNKAEKEAAYEEPYIGICSELFGRGDAYSILKTKGIIKFTTTTHLRGMTFRDAIVIVDECQNLDFGETDTIMTRIGDNCRIIFCGDNKHQFDLKKHQGRGDINQFLSILKNLESFAGIQFEIDDIVRSGVVKEYIIERERQNF